MATIKAIEARSVHQIQSGQVIVDLCSVAKELVENSLDAGATSIEVRFKNNGLDSIEVQDNGGGISPENYESLALKHYTSKLSSYEDLSQLQTFGFRGEALSSLCALSDFSVITAQAHQAPKANRLEFEPSGKLGKTQVVAGQKGTTVSVQGLFKRLPVRRRDLEKNIKREYGKVLNLLHAYACIGTKVRFSVKNTVGKTKNVVVFSTSGNPSTKQNIANVYGAKTLSALIPLDLTLEFEPSATATQRRLGGEDGDQTTNKIQVCGHISRPVFGEGRQTPDRQMFFVNGRPCGLPQIAKAFNEVYKSFNVSQSPFIFADFQMDTNSYDVNVSPDKRTILLHDAGAMIESLKTSLTGLFEASDQTVPQSQLGFKQSSIKPRSAAVEEDSGPGSSTQGTMSSQQGPSSHVHSSQPTIQPSSPVIPTRPKHVEMREDTEPQSTEPGEEVGKEEEEKEPSEEEEGHEDQEEEEEEEEEMPQLSQSTAKTDEQPVSSQADSIDTSNTVQNAFDRMRPRRMPAEVATITIGNRTVTSMVGSGAPKRSADSSGPIGGSKARKRRIHTPSRPGIFGQFSAPGLQPRAEGDSEEGEDELEEEGEEDDIEDDEEEGDEDEEVEEQEEEQEEQEEEEEEVEEEEPGRSPSKHATEKAAEQDVEVSDTEMQDTQDPPEPDEKNEMTEEEKKTHEEAEVQRLIQEAEDKATLPEEHGASRANKMNKGAAHRDSTVQLMTSVDGSLSKIQAQTEKLSGTLRLRAEDDSTSKDTDADANETAQTAEDRLSLTVTKDDFSRMRIIGQFNLGFIIATRPSSDGGSSMNGNNKDELFIIDQHASDEKINFERLQASTVVQNQRLVQPKTLDLTAVEEEIVLENRAALEKNGFVVTIDDSGNEPIGRRCKLISLPLSKEVVFGIRDLEELIVLLSEMGSASDVYVPRPSKVRKMFAMRACRSSIMIGKTLTQRQMEKVVRNMGTIDKPWNCPHGRPTMRHLMSLGQWDDDWDEFGTSSAHLEGTDKTDIWRDYLHEVADEEEEE